MLDHRRSVHPALDLLQEPQVLGDRLPGVFDAVDQLEQGPRFLRSAGLLCRRK